MKIEKLWGGRFEEMPPKEMMDFLSGRDIRGIPPCDERLIPYDLWGSRAHVLMLSHQGILSKQDGKKVLKGLKEIERLYRNGKFTVDTAQEDVHSCIESFLVRRLGIEYGGKIHTGRSRNDQIVLDMFLYLRDQVLTFVQGLIHLIGAFLHKAQHHRFTVMPGYTHHRHAVPTTFAHLLLSFAEAFERDVLRFNHWFTLFNKNPLGAAAGYGTSFHLDRHLTSRFLGFDGPTENVTDPITQRWEPEAELAYAVTVMMNHLSTVAQTLILFSTSEFNMVRLHDRHCTGSSMMPQKRNPCSLEVIKAKTSFAHGITVSLLSAGKSLFIGYNRDTQWTKYWIMDLLEESRPVLPLMAEIIELLHIHEDQMLEQTHKEFSGATLLMEWMVRSFSIPLRKAKMVMEKAVKYSEEEGGQEVSYRGLKRALDGMKIDLPVNEEDVERLQRPEEIFSAIQSIGTSSEKNLKESMASLRQRIKENRNWLVRKQRAIERGKALMDRMERALES